MGKKNLEGNLEDKQFPDSYKLNKNIKVEFSGISASRFHDCFSEM